MDSQDEVRLRATLPSTLGGERVVMSNVWRGDYTLYDGRSWYGTVCRLNLMMSRQRFLVGVGSLVRVGESQWICTDIDLPTDARACLVLQPMGVVDLDELRLPPFEAPLYPDCPMPNLWSQQADICLVEWSADMTDVFRGDPSRIPKLVHRILSAGEACEVYRLHQVPEMGFQRRRHGNPADYLADWYAQGNPGFFGQMLGAEVRAKVAWFDQSGRIVDSELANMADVLTALEPYPGATDPFNTQVEPLRITGPSQSRIESIREGKGIYPAHFRIQLHSDIWLPWVWGLSHPHSDGERMFDNRPLARIHTPRLNGFLSEIASIFSELGCTLRLDDDPDGTRDWVRPWAGPDSIDIEGMIPSKVMPLEVVNAAWSE